MAERLRVLQNLSIFKPIDKKTAKFPSATTVQDLVDLIYTLCLHASDDGYGSITLTDVEINDISHEAGYILTKETGGEYQLKFDFDVAAKTMLLIWNNDEINALYADILSLDASFATGTITTQDGNIVFTGDIL